MIRTKFMFGSFCTGLTRLLKPYSLQTQAAPQMPTLKLKS